MTTTPLEDKYAPRPFGGDYDDSQEQTMRTDLEKVRHFMLGNVGVWLTKKEIRIGSGLPADKDPTPRVRDLRKPRYGGWTVDRKFFDGFDHYRLSVASSSIVEAQ